MTEFLDKTKETKTSYTAEGGGKEGMHGVLDFSLAQEAESKKLAISYTHFEDQILGWQKSVQ